MDFWDIVKTVLCLAFVATMIIGFIWWVVTSFGEILSFSAGFHDLQLAYQISREDIESLTKQEWKMTRRMSYEDRTAFLKERFPDSVPAVPSDV